MPFLIPVVNNIFKESCIEFRICKTEIIYDYNYYILTDDSATNEIEDLKNMYYDPHAINIYIQGSATFETPNGVCVKSSDRPCMFLTYQVPISPEAPIDCTQRFLKYFGLLKTESIASSKELVNGSNGKLAADSVWDTPADPLKILTSIIPTYLPDGSQTPYFYNFTKDANGQYYNPMIYNIMSDHAIKKESLCTKLTHEQNQYLIKNEQRCRQKRWE